MDRDVLRECRRDLEAMRDRLQTTPEGSLEDYQQLAEIQQRVLKNVMNVRKKKKRRCAVM